VYLEPTISLDLALTVSKIPATMSSNSSFTSTSYSSFSSSSSSNGQTGGSHHSHQSHTDPSGTTTRTTSQNAGGPVVEETRSYDPHGRELLSGAQGSDGQSRIQDAGDVEVEDVTDADKQYLERMEDEYAKREGGA